jgi:hypothetical protein
MSMTYAGAPRSIAALIRRGHGQVAVRSMQVALALYERCDHRWNLATMVRYCPRSGQESDRR